MKSPRRLPPRVRIGIAFGADAVVARAAPSVLPGDHWSRVLTGAPTPEGEWPELAAAFAELRALLPRDARVWASIAVLPPLVQIRRLALPPLRAEERRRALTRDAGRWFVGAREAQVADALPVADAAAGVIAAAMPASHALALVRAAEQAGIAVRTIQPAYWGWAALVDAAHRATTHALVVPGTRGVEVVSLIQGMVIGVRRLRPSKDVAAQVAEVLAESGASGARAAVIGDGALAESLVTGLALRGIGRDDDVAGLAASMAGRARGPELLPEFARVSRRALVARRVRALALGAAAMLVVAAGLELWGVHRRVRATQQERAGISAVVSRAFAKRDSATALESQLAMLAAETRAAPRWTGVIADLAQRLPGDAHLLSLSASGDSVAIVGEAAHAADVFEALRRDPRVAGVRADAPIRREFAADRTPVERFSVTARLTPAGLTTMPVADSSGAVP
jgi:hypothetical protein